jgi:hypothetical protein
MYVADPIIIIILAKRNIYMRHRPVGFAGVTILEYTHHLSPGYMKGLCAYRKMVLKAIT